MKRTAFLLAFLLAFTFLFSCGEGQAIEDRRWQMRRALHTEEGEVALLPPTETPTSRPRRP